MELQPFFRRQTALTRFGIVTVHLTQHFQYVAAFIGEVLRHIHELPASMREAVGLKVPTPPPQHPKPQQQSYRALKRVAEPVPVRNAG